MKDYKGIALDRLFPWSNYNFEMKENADDTDTKVNADKNG